MGDDLGDGAASGLPPVLELAWGLRERPTKGPKRGLTLDRIVQAAVTVARAEGMPAVSMGRVAKELGSSPMSLYRYVSTKDDLLTLMLDTAYGQPDPPPAEPGGWRAELAHWASGQRIALYANPWALHIPLSGPPATPNQIVWLEAGLAALRDTWLSEQQKLSTILLISGFVRNEALLSTDIMAAAERAGITADEAMGSYSTALARLIDPRRFPSVYAALTSGALDDDDGLEGEFGFGLERILDGIAVLIDTRSH
ncbi:TetR/AcrR family transcriptional regulator [Streptacidiphilus sp. EB129]|uniref:TetR/AcrR family transcriptional regulator n=1 Tax=Streptacidiphilus sp. EB129 TaxID=3156262 RepID=UPI00351514C7